jgi:hypothetical protein
MIYPVESQLERARALAYAADYTTGSSILDNFDIRDFSKQNSSTVYVVCAPGMPNGQDYRYGWGGRAAIAADWLIGAIETFLNEDDAGLVIIEDPCRAPSDPGFNKGAVGPAWCHNGRVFWPITHEMAAPDLIGKTLRWGLSGKLEIILFCRLRVSHEEAPNLRTINEDMLRRLTTSVTRVVIGIFDGEGYMVWE